MGEKIVQVQGFLSVHSKVIFVLHMVEELFVHFTWHTTVKWTERFGVVLLRSSANLMLTPCSFWLETFAGK